MTVAAIILGLLALGVSVSVVVSEGGLRTILSKNWPTTDAQIEGGETYPVQGRGGTIFRAKLHYSYQVNGQCHRGNAYEDFYNEEDASEFVDSRRGAAGQVKYSPRRPQFSILL